MKILRKRDEDRVASVAVYRDGKLLFGRRQDNGKWTMPAGHLFPGEEPLDGALRELKEETGLTGDLEYLGDGSSGRVSVYSFRCDDSEGEPSGSQDPDEECSEWKWFDPEQLPPDSEMHVPHARNVTLKLLEGADVDKKLKKADPHWKSRDGIKIPKFYTPSRLLWDKEFADQVANVFAGGDSQRLRKIKIPTEAASGTNMPVNKDRLRLYTRMARAGEPLPPVVVRKMGQGYHLVDGNHRQAAAQAAGIPHLDAFEIMDPPAPGKKKKVVKSESDDKVVEGLVSHLSDDLRRAPYKGNENPVTGHCYVASEALWHMLGGKNSGWVPHHINHEGSPHWYLRNRDTGEILDATSSQFKTPVPYEKGRGKGFLTKEPSARAQILMDRYGAGLKKNLKGMLTGAALSLAAPTVSDQGPDQEPQQQQQQPSLASHQVAARQGLPPWTPEGLHQGLIPLAHLESGFGTQMNHAANSRGDYHTAFGALGFKPITAHEEYLKSNRLQQVFPGLQDPSDFTKKFKEDPRFYNLVASSHFLRLRHRHGSPEKAAFAWRWGTGSAAAAPDEQVQNDPYVQRYRSLAADAGVLKPEAVLARVNKHEDEDGINHLLSIDDPRDRRLALKSKQVQPFHLRQALQDEDPQVRLAAALHPQLPPELIREVLRGDDIWLREVVARRPDLRPEELEVALQDPYLWPVISEHAALSEEQRLRMATDPSCPDGLRNELLLEKNIGFLTYPGLGEGKVPTMPMVTNHQGLVNKIKLKVPGAGDLPAGVAGVTAYTSSPSQGLRSPRASGIAGAVVSQSKPARTEVYGRLRNRGVDNPTPGELEQISTDKATAATEAHEGQHSVYARLKQRYGNEATQRIIGHTLAGLSNEDQDLLNHFFRGVGVKVPDSLHNEEKIAYLHNYLMDPVRRGAVHMALRMHNDVDLGRQFQGRIRRIWDSLRRRAAGIRPEDVDVSYRKDEVAIGDWVQNLRKDDSELDHVQVETHLGLEIAMRDYIEAAQFLTGKQVDFAGVRKQLWSCDGDIREAVSRAFGLDTEDKKKALDAVVGIRDHRKSEVETPKQILALQTSGEDVAADIRQAFAAGEVRPVKLGGKHSKGTMIARDADGILWLLKPGSGKQSPAAGAGAEAAGQSRREACFSAVARAWGLSGYVPRCEILGLDGHEVACIRMLPLSWTNLSRAATQDPNLPHRVLEPLRERGVLHRWAVLDWVLGNPDRHGQNLMIGPAGSNNGVALIDHGSAFAGSDYDPVHDQNSFVPYYMRILVPDWSHLGAQERLQKLPRLSHGTDAGLRTWTLDLRPEKLMALLSRYGINPEPTLERLQKLQASLRQGGADAAETVNRLWV